MRHSSTPTSFMQAGLGFTIIELLVTVVIVSVLATVAIPMAEVASRRSKEQQLRAALVEIRHALDAFRDAGDDGRIERRSDASGYPSSLAILVDGVRNASDPAGGRIYFLRRIPRDPFADSSVSAEDTWGKRSYESSADDPQEGADVYDVYSLAPGISLNGVPYREW